MLSNIRFTCPPNEIGDRGRIAFVWHVNDIDSRHALEQFTGQCSVVPFPLEAKVRLAGFAFASATSSCTDLAWIEGFTT
jgi:hypothetical protein